MNWLSNFIRPKISSLVEKKDVPDNLWEKCPSCEGMLFHRDLADNNNVCYHCNHHLPQTIFQRLEMLFDDGKFTESPVPQVTADPLKFKDRKKYTDRLRDSRSKLKRDDAIVIAHGKINGIPTVIAGFDFRFMGGSMGTAVGQAIVEAAQLAIKKKSAFITIPASGGARMQEGALSLMQMPRTIVATSQVKDAGLPYLVLLTNPTTGGVSASFAMVGDVHIAEPGAMIGFAGRRVIEETIREDLPEGFQTAEYLLEHGMVDMVVPRAELKSKISTVLGILMDKEPTESPDGSTPTAKRGKSLKKPKSTGKAPAGATKTTDAARTIASLEDVKDLPKPANEETPAASKVASAKR